jgi:integrase
MQTTTASAASKRLSRTGKPARVACVARRQVNMHRARHTFATDGRRVADLGAASQALGHSDLSTTAAIYGHYDLSDLERSREVLARSRRQEDEEPDD